MNDRNVVADLVNTDRDFVFIFLSLKGFEMKT
jgi:hypothetical protein